MTKKEAADWAESVLDSEEGSKLIEDANRVFLQDTISSSALRFCSKEKILTEFGHLLTEEERKKLKKDL